MMDCLPSDQLSRRKDVAFGFVDLENAVDTVPRELAIPVMIWIEVGEAEVRMVE